MVSAATAAPTSGQSGMHEKLSLHVYHDASPSTAPNIVAAGLTRDQSYRKHVQVAFEGSQPSVFVSVGSDLSCPIQDDVRRYSDAVAKGMKRALDIGARNIELGLQEPPKQGDERFRLYKQVSLLSALNEIYTPLQAREHKGKQAEAVNVSIHGEGEQGDSVVLALDKARSIAKGTR